MAPLRRDGRRPFTRLTPWRVGLFFLGAGTWVGGLLADEPLATGVAIGILLLAALLGIAERGPSDG